MGAALIVAVGILAYVLGHRSGKRAGYAQGYKDGSSQMYALASSVAVRREAQIRKQIDGIIQ